MKATNVIRLSVVVVSGLLVPHAALAQGVGNPGALPTSFDLGSNGWIVTNAAGGPVPVVRDPNGPKWKKDLNGPNNGPLIAQPGFASQLHEFLQVDGNLPWTDWHEDILTPGWSWAPVFFNVNGAPASNLQVFNTLGTSTTGGSISYLFDPVAPGSTVEILKRLVYNAGIPGTVFVGQVHVEEYPTPEPASLALLGAGSLIVFRRRRGIRTNG